MRVLVCGGRGYTDQSAVWGALDSLHQKSDEEPMVVISGGATGADSLAYEWTIRHPSVKSEVYQAQWATFGKSAGMIRNSAMLQLGKPDMVLAFPGGAGTKDMVRRALGKGVPVRTFR